MSKLVDAKSMKRYNNR